MNGRRGTGFSRRDMMRAGAAGFCLCCLPMLARAADGIGGDSSDTAGLGAYGPGTEFTIGEIAPGMFMRHGINQDANAQNLDAIANIGFIVGKDSVLVTDSGGSLADGEWLRKQIKAKTDKPIRYVVISHVHPDHAFGAGAFVDDKPTIIGHAKLPVALNMRGEFYKKELGNIIGPDKVGPIVMPTKTVADTDQIDLGDRIITFKAHGIAHTNCDLSMLDKTSGLLLPADLLFVNRVPALDGSLLGWLKQLDVLAAMGAKRAVPGHGPVTVDFAPSAAALRSYLVDIRDGVQKIIKQNGTIDEAVKTVGQNQASKWLLFAGYNGRNVTEAFQELEWQ